MRLEDSVDSTMAERFELLRNLLKEKLLSPSRLPQPLDGS
jgi:hypothetical protein